MCVIILAGEIFFSKCLIYKGEMLNEKGKLGEVYPRVKNFKAEKNSLNRSVEIDGLSQINDKLLVVDCKYRKNKYTNEMYNHLKESVSLFSEKLSKSYYLFSKSGFSEDFIKEENVTQNTRLGLYPNPSSNMVNIGELDAEVCKEIMIFDMTGRLMKHFSNDVNLDVSDLPTGLYMMRVITGEGKRYTEKFMISR